MCNAADMTLTATGDALAKEYAMGYSCMDCARTDTQMLKKRWLFPIALEASSAYFYRVNV